MPVAARALQCSTGTRKMKKKNNKRNAVVDRLTQKETTKEQVGPVSGAVVVAQEARYSSDCCWTCHCLRCNISFFDKKISLQILRTKWPFFPQKTQNIRKPFVKKKVRGTEKGQVCQRSPGLTNDSMVSTFSACYARFVGRLTD